MDVLAINGELIVILTLAIGNCIRIYIANEDVLWRERVATVMYRSRLYTRALNACNF